jgi:hypothetical protein
MKREKKPPDPYRTVKNALANVVTDNRTLALISGAVTRIHRISTHAQQFLKLYLLHERETTGQFPVVDHDLILNVLKTVSADPVDKRGRPPTAETVLLRRKLTAFYQRYYAPTIAPGDEPQSYLHLGAVLEYVATRILADYENNIKRNYYRYVQKYVRHTMGWQECRPTLTKEERKKYDWTVRQVLNDVLEVGGGDWKSPPECRRLVSSFKDDCLPKKYEKIVVAKLTVEDLEKHHTGYDVQVHPWDYFEPMYRMLLQLNFYGDKLYNLFPQCSSQVPRHITIDTKTVHHLLLDTNLHPQKPSYENKLEQFQQEIWSTFFRTDMRCFQRGPYSFNHIISTDGVAVSLPLVREEYQGLTAFAVTRKIASLERKISKEAEAKAKAQGKPLPPKKKHKGFYITDMPDPTVLKGKTIVAIDPGKSDLLFAVTVPDEISHERKENAVKLRYTQNQRRKEMQTKKQRDHILTWKQESVIEERTVIEWEALLAYDPITNIKHPFNSRSVSFSKYQAYLRIKNLVTDKLRSFYADPIFRKFHLHTYSNTQRSESLFMDRFRQTFGGPGDVVVGFGDWSDSSHRKGHEPLKGVGFHKMIRNAGYELVLVNEYRTSKTCSNCKDGSECEYFRKCENPRPWRRKYGLIDRHGIVICQSCQTPWNRDVNAALNIHEIMKKEIAGKGRPEYFKKKKDPELPCDSQYDRIGL